MCSRRVNGKGSIRLVRIGDMSSKKIASIPLSYDWGRKVEPPRGSPNRQQWHTWKHEFPIESPPRKTNRAYVNKAVESQRGTFVSTQEFLERTAAAGELVIPQWAKNEKTVLSFNGFFLEAVNDSADEIFRVREVVIKYWVLDGSMAIVEPTTNNSGMPQGALVKRHKIVMPDSSYLKLEELKFGNEIEVYGKKIRIVNCDQFTRKILSDVDLGE